MAATASRLDPADILRMKPLRPHAGQSRLWRETGARIETLPDGRRRISPPSKLRAIVPAGRRSGKTELAIANAKRWAVSPYAYVSESPRVGFGAPTHLHAKRIYWKRLKRSIPPHWIADVSESELTLTLRHPISSHLPGVEFVVVGLDVPERIEGMHWDGFVLDEYADMHSAVWQEHVLPALSTPGRMPGFAWLIGVPAGRNHYWDLWCRAQTDPTWCAVTWKSSEIMDALEVAALRAAMDPRTFRQEMEASFEEASGRVYYAFDRLLDVHQFGLPADIGTESRPWMGGMDFNVDPMRAVWGWEEERWGPSGKETHVYVWDEIEKRTSNTDETGRTIRASVSEAARFGVFLMHPDPSGAARKTSAPAGQTDHTILKELGFRVRTRLAAPPRRDRFNAVNTMFVTGSGLRRTHVHPRCTALIRDLEAVVYAEGRSDPDEKKCGRNIHGTDAYGYWIEKRHRLSAQVARGFDPEAVARGEATA